MEEMADNLTISWDSSIMLGKTQLTNYSQYTLYFDPENYERNFRLPIMARDNTKVFWGNNYSFTNSWKWFFANQLIIRVYCSFIYVPKRSLI